MKKIWLTMTIAVFLLICLNGLQAQTTQPKLNQVELMTKLVGTWQATVGKDTLEVWDCQQIGKALVINVYQIIKGQKMPLMYTNSMGFNSVENKFKGYVLWSNGTYSTWIGAYYTENQCSVEMVQDYNPKTTFAKYESLIVSPKEWTWKTLSKDGVKISELKFLKVQ